jgi:hypothetical protein
MPPHCVTPAPYLKKSKNLEFTTNAKCKIAFRMYGKLAK